jgi:hypothetical protein
MKPSKPSSCIRLCSRSLLLLKLTSSSLFLLIILIRRLFALFVPDCAKDFGLLPTLMLTNGLSVMVSVDAIIESQLDFRVFYIPGVDNVVADHLSRWRNSAAETTAPGLSICSFLPPRNTLGADKK